MPDIRVIADTIYVDGEAVAEIMADARPGLRDRFEAALETAADDAAGSAGLARPAGLSSEGVPSVGPRPARPPSCALGTGGTQAPRGALKGRDGTPLPGPPFHGWHE